VRVGRLEVRVGRGSDNMLTDIAEQEFFERAEFVMTLTSVRVVP